MPKGAPNADVAFAFMKWVSEHPQAQADWTTALTVPTPTNKLKDLVAPDIYASLPSGFDLTPVPRLWMNQNADEVQRRWKQFLTGT